MRMARCAARCAARGRAVAPSPAAQHHPCSRRNSAHTPTHPPTHLADLGVQLRVAVPVRLERDQALDGGGPRRVQQRGPPPKQLAQHLRLRQAQACRGGGAGAGGVGQGRGGGRCARRTCRVSKHGGSTEQCTTLCGTAQNSVHARHGAAQRSTARSAPSMDRASLAAAYLAACLRASLALRAGPRTWRDRGGADSKGGAAAARHRVPGKGQLICAVRLRRLPPCPLPAVQRGQSRARSIQHSDQGAPSRELGAAPRRPGPRPAP